MFSSFLSCEGKPKTRTPTPTPTPPEPAVAPPPSLDAKPAPDARLAPDAFVDPTSLDPTIALDMRYATERNFVGEAVYPIARCLLRVAVAERLVRASRAVAKRGFKLVLWDCYRPFSVQETFFAKVSDPRYVARPVRKNGMPYRGSKHNRGAAVDLTLANAAGDPVEMPTDFDEFSKQARRTAPWSKTARHHADVLHLAMTAAGFTPIDTEWWHYDGPEWEKYPLSDTPLD